MSRGFSVTDARASALSLSHEQLSAFHRVTDLGSWNVLSKPAPIHSRYKIIILVFNLIFMYSLFVYIYILDR